MKSFDELYSELLSKRLLLPQESSTVAAWRAGVHFQGKKLLEEAGEVWLAAEYEDNESLALEVSQLLYWAQVLMIGRGLSLSDVYRHL